MSTILKRVLLLSLTFSIDSALSQTQNPWEFKKNKSPLFQDSSVLELHFGANIKHFGGNLVKAGRSKKDTPRPLPKEEIEVCFKSPDFSGNFTVSREYGTFGATCRIPKLKLEINDTPDKVAKFLEFSGSDHLYISLPCHTVERNSEFGSDHLEEAVKENKFEFIMYRLFSDMGLPALKVRQVKLRHGNQQIFAGDSAMSGFLLESALGVSNRHDGQLIERTGDKIQLDIGGAGKAAASIQTMLSISFDVFSEQLNPDNDSWSLSNVFFVERNNAENFFLFFDFAIRNWKELWNLGTGAYGKLAHLDEPEATCKVARYLVENRVNWSSVGMPLAMIDDRPWTVDLLEKIQKFYVSLESFSSTYCKT